MAVFNYKVVDRDGKNKKGTIEAPNRDGAEKKLKSEGYSIMSLTEQSSPLGDIGLFKKKVKSELQSALEHRDGRLPRLHDHVDRGREQLIRIVGGASGSTTSPTSTNNLPPNFSDSIQH